MAYQYPLNGGRINASISGNSTSAGAGYQLVSTGTLVLAGGNNVTLNQNANSISIAGPSLSNSNGFTFGTNGSVVTASYAGGGSINFSAGTTSGNLASVNLSNANGVSFGLNAGTITASHNALTSQSAQALSASNGSFAFQTAGFSNANGVTFGTSAGSIMTASVNTSYAASNHSHGNPTLNLTNLSGTTASASNGLTLSLSAASQSVQTQSNIQGIIANGSTNRTGDVSFANSNGVTFGLNNNTITASVAAAGQTNQTLGLYASGNSTGQSSSSTMDARSLSISAQGGVSAGFSGGMMQMSAPAVSSLSQTGIVSISRNGNTISIGAPAFSAGASNLGNTAGNTMTVSNQIVFAGGNNITLSQTTGAGGATMSIIGGAGGGGGVALANSQTTYTSGTANLVGSGAISVNSTTGQSYIISAPAQSNLSATGAVSISNNGNTISIGAPVQTNQTLGMYIASNSVTNATTSGTVDARSLTFRGVGNASIGISNGSVVISASGGGGVAIAGPTGTFTSGTVNFGANNSGAITVASTTGQQLNFSVPATSVLSGVGGISISTTGSTIAFSAGGGGGGASPVFSAGTASASLGSVVFSNSNGVSFGLNGSTITASAAGGDTLTMDYYQNMDRGATATLAVPFANSLMFQRLNQENNLFAGNITANTVLLNMTGNINATATTAHTVSAYIGIYTDNATNLSLLNSVSTSWGLAGGNNTSVYNGPRWLSFVSSQWSAAPVFSQGGDYVFGILMKSSSYAPPLSYYGQNYMFSNQRSGYIGTTMAINTSMAHGNFWNAVMATASLPSSVNSTQVNRNNASAIFMPHIILNNRYSSL